MNYAIIKDGVCVNVIVANKDFADSIGAIPLPTGFGIGDSFDGGTWTRFIPVEQDPLPFEPTSEERIEALEQALLMLMEV